ncbi:MAG TPA: nuclease A inhibitor family protein [Leptolyngbyaceae cyanobacterium]
MTAKDEFIAALKAAIAPIGEVTPLTYPSETDSPLSVVIWEMNELTPATLQQQLSLPADSPIEERTIASFFDRVTCDSPEVPCIWQGSDTEIWFHRYRNLRELLTRHLTNIKVYRVGRTEIDVYVLGQYCSGTYIGIRTQVVET